MKLGDPINVYVPAPAAQSARRVIRPASGIVGSPTSEWTTTTMTFDELELGARGLAAAVRRAGSTTTLTVDFEGNLYDAANIKTWADRVKHAAGRHQEQYPTVARMEIQAQDMLLVGTFHPDDGYISLVFGKVTREILYEWLGLESKAGRANRERDLHEQLVPELTVTR